MEINVFLNNIKQDFIESCNLYHPNQIGNSITIYKENDEFPDLNEFQLAIVGVEEERNSFDNIGCKDAPNAIRKSLYQLFNHWKDIKIEQINNLDNIAENTTAAESAIRDTDMATTMVEFSNANILAQAGQSMLAQANQSNQGVLGLLG